MAEYVRLEDGKVAYRTNAAPGLDLTRKGLYEVTGDPPTHDPRTQYAEVTSIDIVGDKAVRTWTIRDRENVPPIVVSKLDLVDRLTDAEVEVMHALKTGTAQTVSPVPSAMQKRIAARWEAAVEIHADDPQAVQAMTAIFGDARARELLTP